MQRYNQISPNSDPHSPSLPLVFLPTAPSVVALLPPINPPKQIHSIIPRYQRLDVHAFQQLIFILSGFKSTLILRRQSNNLLSIFFGYCEFRWFVGFEV